MMGDETQSSLLANSVSFVQESWCRQRLPYLYFVSLSSGRSQAKVALFGGRLKIGYANISKQMVPDP
jgi:hypothetical protein